MVNLFIILLFISLFFSPICFSQEIIKIPVISNEQKIDLKSKAQINYNNAQESLENPSKTNVNTQILSPQKNSSEQSSIKSIQDIKNQISSASVRQYGGENGFSEIHLRGTRAFEPSFYFEDLPLASAQNGNQNLSLLPSSGIGIVQIYPDSPPFWLFSQGIGGDINIKNCEKTSCFEDVSSNHLFKILYTTGSYHFNKISFSHGYNKNKKLSTFETVEYTKSLEDYPVFNNNNSTLHTNEGVYENLQNNDFSQFATSMGIKKLYPVIGRLNLNVAYGSKKQGVPGPTGVLSNSRLEESLIVASLKTEKIFFNSGIEWKNNLGFLNNWTRISSPLAIFSSQGTFSRFYTLQAKSTVIFPTQFILNEQTGASVEVLNSISTIENKLVTNPSQISSSVESNRLDYKASLFEGFTYVVNNNIPISANINAWISKTQDSILINCLLSHISLCQKYTNLINTSPIHGYSFSLQGEIYSIIPYFRYVKTSRRPYLSELYGSPGGILANQYLLNETSKKQEIGFKFNFGETGIFHAQDSNLIFLQPSNQVSSQYINLQSGFRKGYFLNLEKTFFHHISSSFDYQYLSSIFIQNKQSFQVPRSPKHTINISSSIKEILLPSIFEYNTMFLFYLNGQYESPFYLDIANQNTLDVPATLNAGINFKFSQANQKLKLSLDIYNLTNENFSTLYNSNGYAIQANSNGYLDLPPPGRRFYLSLSGEF